MPDKNTELDELVQYWTNANGHGFQAAVLAECAKRSGLVGREVPVVLRGAEFHVDGILTLSVQRDVHRFVAVECKRVDPAWGVWCFAKTEVGIDTPNPGADFFTVEGAKLRATAGYLHPKAGPIAHAAFELKKKEKGNALGKQLDSAVTQAWRGAGGYTHVLADFFESASAPVSWRIQPLVVTTAPLLLLKQPLETAAIATGDIDDCDYEEVPWLWYEMNLNTSLTPVAERVHPPFHYTLRDIVRFFSRRAVMICSPRGLPDALLALEQMQFQLMP